MKNLIIIDTFGECMCACVTNIYDSTDRILIAFEAGDYTQPQIELSYNETTFIENLDIVNGFAVYRLPYTIFTDEIRSCDFRYIDGEKIGKWFEIYAGSFHGTVYSDSTLKVCKNDETTFSISLVKIKTNPAKSYSSSDFNISDTGELSLQTPHEVTVSVNDDDLVTNVDFDYGDDYHKSFSVEWDPSTGKITKFGNLPINWE